MRTSKIFLGIIFLFASACNQHKSGTKTQTRDTVIAVKQEPEHEGTVLTLNEGKKWKIDEPTRININEINQTFTEFADKKRTDYLNLATELQKESDKLVSECKMTGKDHEMLHVWLEKFLSALKELKASDKATQETGFHKIDELLKGFDGYFE